MPDELYENPRLAAFYDSYWGWSRDSDFYLALAGAPPQHILDLGCGTGVLCEAYAARGHIVTGADPTPAMLAIARQKPHGKQIEWVQATAQEFRSERRFDLITMTGHAFQVMLSDDDVMATLTTMRDHLKPTGRAVFESRNPAIDWAAEWNGSEDLTDRGVPIRYTTEVLSRVGDRVSFEQRFAFPDETLVSFSELRFLPKEEIEARLAAVGLAVEALYGDWDSSPFDPASSHEMIFVTRLA